jgi:hypothetical protein
MGRGLSDLQQWILRRAARQGQLYNHEILSGFYGWRPSRRGPRPEDIRFSPGLVGQRYGSVRAAVSRACRRLEDRGLVTCFTQATRRWAAVAISEAGRHWVELHWPDEHCTARLAGPTDDEVVPGGMRMLRLDRRREVLPDLPAETAARAT